ncbi:MAG: hypothetical protein CML17_07870 [Pusillimonas sp.]|nr:hypothetical protein [Pusillimonas sp.]|tara:strand:+ start:3372 stop:3560 length:189 start_codon:yes stop_codon:yes gene_type:complete
MNASDRNAIIRSFVVAISIMFFACIGIFYIGKTVITDPIMDKLDTMQRSNAANFGQIKKELK